MGQVGEQLSEILLLVDSNSGWSMTDFPSDVSLGLAEQFDIKCRYNSVYWWTKKFTVLLFELHVIDWNRHHNEYRIGLEELQSLIGSGLLETPLDECIDKRRAPYVSRLTDSLHLLRQNSNTFRNFFFSGRVRWIFDYYLAVYYAIKICIW